MHPVSLTGHGRRKTHMPSFTSNRFDYKKTPLSASDLFCAIHAHVTKSFDGQVFFCCKSSPSHRLLAVSEFPFVFAFATALHLMVKDNRRAHITVSYDECGDSVHLTLAAKMAEIKLPRAVFEEHGAALVDIAAPSHFTSDFVFDDTQVTYHLTAPLYNADTFAVYATEKDITALILAAFEEARKFTA